MAGMIPRMTRDMIVTRVLAALNLLFWSGLSLIGVSLIAGVAERIAPAEPDPIQVRWYVIFPAAMAVLAATALFWLIFGSPRRRVLGLVIARVLVGASLLILLPYLLVYGGGV